MKYVNSANQVIDLDSMHKNHLVNIINKARCGGYGRTSTYLTEDMENVLDDLVKGRLDGQELSLLIIIGKLAAKELEEQQIQEAIAQLKTNVKVKL